MKNKNYMAIYMSIILLAIIATFVLISLKLSGAMSVSWWWIFCPLWIPSCLSAVLFLIGMIVIFIKDKIIDRKKYIIKEIWDE